MTSTTEPGHLADRDFTYSHVQATKATRTDYAAGVICRLAEESVPGIRLGTKDELRARCAVSVGTFNEALALASARGFISMRSGPGGGVFVSEQTVMVKLGNSMLALNTTEPSATEAIRIRDALDPLLIDDAARFASGTDVEQLRACLVKMRDAMHARDPIAFVRANWSLHRGIASASPNALLRSVYLGLLDVLEASAIAVRSGEEIPLTDYIQARFNLHERIVDAIERRDRVLAQELIAAHHLNG